VPAGSYQKKCDFFASFMSLKKGVRFGVGSGSGAGSGSEPKCHGSPTLILSQANDAAVSLSLVIFGSRDSSFIYTYYRTDWYVG
jgi:hypothetical protein